MCISNSGQYYARIDNNRQQKTTLVNEKFKNKCSVSNFFVDEVFNFCHTVRTMGKPKQRQAPKHTGTPRPNLANLLRIPKKFKLDEGFTIDNPHFTPDDPQDNPSRDEIIRAIGLAYPEFLSLVKEFDNAKSAAVENMLLVQESFRAVTGRYPKKGEQIINIIMEQATFGRQCEDVLRNIVNNLPADKAKTIATEFLKRSDPEIGGNILTLVNEKNTDGNSSSQPPTAP